MPKVDINVPAPDFSLQDISGETIQLSDYKGEKHVLLVLNRGFS